MEFEQFEDNFETNHGDNSDGITWNNRRDDDESKQTDDDDTHYAPDEEVESDIPATPFNYFGVTYVHTCPECLSRYRSHALYSTGGLDDGDAIYCRTTLLDGTKTTESTQRVVASSRVSQRGSGSDLESGADRTDLSFLSSDSSQSHDSYGTRLVSTFKKHKLECFLGVCVMLCKTLTAWWQNKVQQQREEATLLLKSAMALTVNNVSAEDVPPLGEYLVALFNKHYTSARVWFNLNFQPEFVRKIARALLSIVVVHQIWRAKADIWEFLSYLYRLRSVRVLPKPEFADAIFTDLIFHDDKPVIRGEVGQVKFKLSVPNDALAVLLSTANGQRGFTPEAAMPHSRYIPANKVPDCVVVLFDPESKVVVGQGFRYDDALILTEHELEILGDRKYLLVNPNTRESLEVNLKEYQYFFKFLDQFSLDVVGFQVPPSVWSCLKIKRCKLVPTIVDVVCSIYTVNDDFSAVQAYGKVSVERNDDFFDVRHKISTQAGSSGAPVFCGDSVVAIHVGHAPEYGCNVAVSMDFLRKSYAGIQFESNDRRKRAFKMTVQDWLPDEYSDMDQLSDKVRKFLEKHPDDFRVFRDNQNDYRVVHVGEDPEWYVQHVLSEDEGKEFMKQYNERLDILRTHDQDVEERGGLRGGKLKGGKRRVVEAQIPPGEPKQAYVDENQRLVAVMTALLEKLNSHKLVTNSIGNEMQQIQADISVNRKVISEIQRDEEKQKADKQKIVKGLLDVPEEALKLSTPPQISTIMERSVVLPIMSSTSDNLMQEESDSQSVETDRDLDLAVNPEGKGGQKKSKKQSVKDLSSSTIMTSRPEDITQKSSLSDSKPPDTKDMNLSPNNSAKEQSSGQKRITRRRRSRKSPQPQVS